MKVLILSVCTGHGHNQVATSIMNRLNEEKNITANVIDVFSYCSRLLGKSISEGYLIATKYAPTYYGTFYRKAEQISSEADFSFIAFIDKLLSKKIRFLLEEQRPDIIICTHVFAAKLLGRFSQELSGTIKMGVVTDYTLHPFWEKTILDYIIVPSENVKEEAILKGIAGDKLLPLGMPVHEKFLNKTGKAIARESLAIADKNTILVMGGSMGFGSIDQVISKLDSTDLDFQILCVCGTNNEMREKVQNLRTSKSVFTYGFINNVELFMDAADCIITKPGGITISECLVKQLPMILTSPIPGQEDRNVEFLDKSGAALIINDNLSLEKAVEYFFTSGNAKERMIGNINKIAKPLAVEDICKFVISHQTEDVLGM